ncbi:J domain-containing protein [Aliivibrio fischeri]|uniref:J domain-containing protein n=1 Tax=Aliivibrio fischeri TaxID=668 RepID=UPI001F3994F8|nr:J domain-containing protein [Aliivibrio fischeri]MCE7576499.1 J domain-containing protein [Aliivibrio fischeri]MCE7588789.1 J domain-containing protein [Aliivibrio fischeri]
MFDSQYVYKIIKKDGESLAIPNSAGIFDSMELSALYAQGYVFCCEITAPTPSRAIEIYNELVKSEIIKLQQEITRLQAECSNLQRQNESLKQNSSQWSHESSNSIKYYELFGFSEFPQPDELKKRFKSIQSKLHPDKGGDKQLSQLFNKAYSVLTKH